MFKNKFCKEIFKYITSGLLGGFIGAGVILTISFVFFKDSCYTPPTNLSYAELASINLTVATIVLGVIALIVAIGSIFGYQAIKARSVVAAKKATKGHVKNKIHELVKIEIQNLVDNGTLKKIIEGTQPLEKSSSISNTSDNSDDSHSDGSYDEEG